MMNIMTDMFNGVFNLMEKLKQYIGLKLSFYVTFVSCKLRGIRIGENNIFHGVPKIMRARTASISIGDNCNFISTSFSNILGVNRRCSIMATMDHASVTIGNGCGFSGVSIACAEKIEIGDHVRVGPNTIITDSDWHIEDIRSGGSSPVKIESNVWLGANVVVLKGVHIGQNALVAANSVVFKNIPPNCIALGNPCEVVFNPN